MWSKHEPEWGHSFGFGFGVGLHGVDLHLHSHLHRISSSEYAWLSVRCLWIRAGAGWATGK